MFDWMEKEKAFSDGMDYAKEQVEKWLASLAPYLWLHSTAGQSMVIHIGQLDRLFAELGDKEGNWQEKVFK